MIDSISRDIFGMQLGGEKKKKGTKRKGKGIRQGKEIEVIICDGRTYF